MLTSGSRQAEALSAARSAVPTIIDIPVIEVTGELVQAATVNIRGLLPAAETLAPQWGRMITGNTPQEAARLIAGNIRGLDLSKPAMSGAILAALMFVQSVCGKNESYAEEVSKGITADLNSVDAEHAKRQMEAGQSLPADEQQLNYTPRGDAPEAPANKGSKNSPERVAEKLNDERRAELTKAFVNESKNGITEDKFNKIFLAGATAPNDALGTSEPENLVTAVRKVQEALKATDPKLIADGILGEKTLAALKTSKEYSKIFDKDTTPVAKKTETEQTKGSELLTKLPPQPQTLKIKEYYPKDMQDKDFFQVSGLENDAREAYGLMNGEVVYVAGTVVKKNKEWLQLYKQNGDGPILFPKNSGKLTAVTSLELNTLEEAGITVASLLNAPTLLNAKTSAEKIAAFRQSFPKDKLTAIFNAADTARYERVFNRIKNSEITAAQRKVVASDQKTPDEKLEDSMLAERDAGKKLYANATVILPAGAKKYPLVLIPERKSGTEVSCRAPQTTKLNIGYAPVAILEQVTVGDVNGNNRKEYLKIATASGVIGYIEKTDSVVAAITEKRASNTNAVA